MAPELPAPAAHASVVFLKVRGFAGLAVAQQARLRAQLLAAAAAAIAVWEEQYRVVLDAPDGTVIVGMGRVGLALDAAMRAHQTEGGAASLAIGVHHGRVKVLPGGVAGTRVVGDGIDTAATVAGFATEGQILASSGFRDALAGESPFQARALLPAGQFVDERLRAHELFVHDASAARIRGRRRTLLGAAGIAGVLGLGYAARLVLQSIEAARRPAVVQLDIRPWGDVYVDGELKGRAPALNRLWIKPGAHTIEVRNSRFKPLKMEVDLKAGEELEVKHAFGGGPVKRPGLLDRLKFWR